MENKDINMRFERMRDNCQVMENLVNDIDVGFEAIKDMTVGEVRTLSRQCGWRGFNKLLDKAITEAYNEN